MSSFEFNKCITASRDEAGADVAVVQPAAHAKETVVIIKKNR